MFKVFSFLHPKSVFSAVEKGLGKLGKSSASDCPETVSKIIAGKSKIQSHKTMAKISPELPSPKAINYRAYAQIDQTPIKRLYRKHYGYAVSKESKPLKEYTGPREKTDGFSTIIDYEDFGGGWLEGSINTPLETNSPHNCAILNLVNTETNKQILFHVHPRSKNSDIRYFINTKFRDFDKANILSGDDSGTLETVRKIVDALDGINPNAPKDFHHLSSFRPGVVAHNGDLSYIKNNYRSEANFQEIKQFFYDKPNIHFDVKKTNKTEE